MFHHYKMVNAHKLSSNALIRPIHFNSIVFCFDRARLSHILVIPNCYAYKHRNRCVCTISHSFRSFLIACCQSAVRFLNALFTNWPNAYERRRKQYYDDRLSGQSCLWLQYVHWIHDFVYAHTVYYIDRVSSIKEWLSGELTHFTRPFDRVYTDVSISSLSLAICVKDEEKKKYHQPHVLKRTRIRTLTLHPHACV